MRDLDLAHNAFNDKAVSDPEFRPPAQELGLALKSNNTLTRLDVGYNGITAKGASVIASTLPTNRTLQFLRFDGNNQGAIGQVCDCSFERTTRIFDCFFNRCDIFLAPQAALLRAQREASTKERTLNATYKHCDFSEPAVLDEDMFDPKRPAKAYDLDLSQPYDLMVAEQLVKVCPPLGGSRCAVTKIKTCCAIDRLQL